MTVTPRAAVAPSSEVFDALAYANEQLKERQAKPDRVSGSGGWFDPLRELVQQAAESPDKLEQEPATAPDPVKRDQVRIYASLAHKAIEQGNVPALRVWLLLRHLDEQGRGWTTTEEALNGLSKKTASTYICGQRRVRQILQNGEGIFWTRREGRVWITGAAKVCRNLGVTHLDGQPVFVPLKGITDSLKRFKAHLYATAHSRRPENKSAPISRTALRQITNTSERSQQEYDNLLNVERVACYHLGEAYSKDNLIESYWQHGNGFEFIDVRGRHGRKGAKYVARRLGNTYNVTQQLHTANGRKKKINHYLNGLVKKPTQGNEQEKVDKLYFSNAKAAIKSTQTTTRYYAASGSHQPRYAKEQSAIWFSVDN